MLPKQELNIDPTQAFHTLQQLMAQEISRLYGEIAALHVHIAQLNGIIEQSASKTNTVEDIGPD